MCKDSGVTRRRFKEKIFVLLGEKGFHVPLNLIHKVAAKGCTTYRHRQQNQVMEPQFTGTRLVSSQNV